MQGNSFINSKNPRYLVPPNKRQNMLPSRNKTVTEHMNLEMEAKWRKRAVFTSQKPGTPTFPRKNIPIVKNLTAQGRCLFWEQIIPLKGRAEHEKWWDRKICIKDSTAQGRCLFWEQIIPLKGRAEPEKWWDRKISVKKIRSV